MDSTMIQENVTRESIRRENVRNCIIIFVAGIGVVLGLGLIGVFFTYMIHSYELKNFASGPRIYAGHCSYLRMGFGSNILF